MPRSLMRSPRRRKNTSPRGLAMSRMPMVSPSRRSGRGRRGRIVGLRSEVGSRSTATSISLGFDLPGHRQTAAFAAGRPASNNAGKHTGVTSGVDDHQSVRLEFVYRFARERRRATLGNPVGAGDEFGARYLTQAIKLF